MCYAQSPSPQNWENKTSTAMQKHKRVLLPAQARAPVSSSAVESWQSPEPRFTAVFISLEQRQGVGKGWLAAGVSWYLLIGQSSSLWLARVIISLIGQSYHLSDWPELPSPEALEAWLRDYFWPSAPLWACHGSGEVVTFPPVFRGTFLFVLGYSLILLSKHK